MACVRRSSYKVRRALIRLQPAGPLNMTGTSPSRINRIFLPEVNGDTETTPVVDAVFMGMDDRPWGSCEADKAYDIKTQGTVVFYVVEAAYMLIHHSQFFGELQRVRFAGFVNQYLAHWRCWVLVTPGQTLGDNFLTKECYTDMVTSCHEAIFQTEIFRMFAPSLPLALLFSGSNICENSFSGAGGYRGSYGKRNYNCKGYVDWAENEYVMYVLETAGVRRGRSQHSKQEWDHRCHEPLKSHEDLQRLLRRHPPKATKVRSWNAGADDATHLAEKMGLKQGVSPAAWTDPWTAMNEKLHVMEVADDDDSDDDDSDDEIFLDPQVPPSENTFSTLDLKIVTSQCLRQCLQVDDADCDDVTAQTLLVVFQFLFNTEIDVEAVNEIVARVVDPMTPAERQRLQKIHRENRYVTIPGTDTLISKAQLCQHVVQEVRTCPPHAD